MDPTTVYVINGDINDTKDSIVSILLAYKHREEKY